MNEAPDVRNVWTYIGHWLAVTSWVLLGVRVLGGQLGAIDDALDWLYVAVLGGALVAATLGVTAIGKRGEAALAIAVLGFSLALPALYVLFFLAVGSLLPDGGFD